MSTVGRITGLSEDILEIQLSLCRINIRMEGLLKVFIQVNMPGSYFVLGLYIYVYILHHQVTLLVQISLTLSLSLSSLSLSLIKTLFFALYHFSKLLMSRTEIYVWLLVWLVYILQLLRCGHFAQSTDAVEYTDCTSAEGKTSPPLPMSVLDMTLNNLMVRFQWYWSFGECGVPLHCHCSQVHSGPAW